MRTRLNSAKDIKEDEKRITAQSHVGAHPHKLLNEYLISLLSKERVI
jgi:hypothetical protein